MDGRNVRFVAGLHGNERAPVRALRELGIDFLLGNPAAFSRNLRFLEEDLNASFGTCSQSLEGKRASEILESISETDVVIDFHTTSAQGEPFAIITDTEMLPLASRTGCRYVALMTHNIKGGHALIDHRDGISIEISGNDTQDAFEMTIRIVEHLKSNREYPITLLEVFGKITEPGDYTNLVQHPSGFYPVLVGEEAYDFIGLKARKIAP